jgi:hypothetical protein
MAIVPPIDRSSTAVGRCPRLDTISGRRLAPICWSDAVVAAPTVRDEAPRTLMFGFGRGAAAAASADGEQKQQDARNSGGARNADRDDRGE